jgi:hypothetical protein
MQKSEPFIKLIKFINLLKLSFLTLTRLKQSPQLKMFRFVGGKTKAGWLIFM